MTTKRNFRIGTIFATILLVSVAFLSIVSAQAGTSFVSPDVKQVILTLDQKDGVLYIPTESKTITDLSTTKTVTKSATANLSGTIDKDNFVLLEGVITLDGEKDNVQLSGNATQVFIGWDMPKGAKPIYSTVGNMTMTRYEGATEIYATYVDLHDKEGKYKLHGEFYNDENGCIVGKVMKNGVECEIGLLGSSINMYRNVSPTVMTAYTSRTLNVPQRSQWEIFVFHLDYSAASQACGETCAAMLEEYWSGVHPDIYDIWHWNQDQPMDTTAAKSYLNSKGVYLTKGLKTGSISYTIGQIESMIDNGRPFFLTEKSRWGTCHAVVLKGYDTTPTANFYLNDPNTETGSNIMFWYHDDDPSFNYVNNVYEYIGSTDTSSTGYSYLR